MIKGCQKFSDLVLSYRAVPGILNLSILLFQKREYFAERPWIYRLNCFIIP